MAPSAFPAARSTIAIPQSPIFAGLEWLGEQISNPVLQQRGDTFPITWGDDDHLYTSAGDPNWGPSHSGLDIERLSGEAPTYTLTQINPMTDFIGLGGTGPKPTGMLCVDGILYLAFQNATGRGEVTTMGDDVIMNFYGHGYDAHIVSSSDHGLTWHPPIGDITRPMFPGRIFGAPAFINMGQDYRAAQDAYVYAISGEGWDNGSHCRLGRVPRDMILDRAQWEWVSAFTQDQLPVWTSVMEQAIPILTHPGYLGTVEMVYLAAFKRYLLLSWHYKVKASPNTGSELIIYDAPTPWGPFTLVHHEDLWETALLGPYNPRLPLKWFDEERLEGWLLFSGNWGPEGQELHYRSHIRHFHLRLA